MTTNRCPTICRSKPTRQPPKDSWLWACVAAPWSQFQSHKSLGQPTNGALVTIPEPQIVGPAHQRRPGHNSRATNRWASGVRVTIPELQIVGPAAPWSQFQSHKSLGHTGPEPQIVGPDAPWSQFQSHKSLGQPTNGALVTIPEPQIVGPHRPRVTNRWATQAQSHKSLGQPCPGHNSGATNRWASRVRAIIREPQLVGRPPFCCGLLRLATSARGQP
jgi:hypothetical protein